MSSDLRPQLTNQVEFSFKEVLLANDPLAQWIANLGRGLNDLLLANRRLEESFETDGIGSEAIYDIKQVAVHAWELAKFLRVNESDEVKAFLGQLDEKTQEHYRVALDALQEPTATTSNGERSFRSHLASARDQASHYATLEHKLLVRALTNLSDNNNNGEVSFGSIQFGEAVKEFYAQFATLVEYQLFFPLKDEDLTPLKEFVAELREVVLRLISFSVDVMRNYLAQYEDKLKVTEL